MASRVEAVQTELGGRRAMRLAIRLEECGRNIVEGHLKFSPTSSAIGKDLLVMKAKNSALFRIARGVVPSGRDDFDDPCPWPSEQQISQPGSMHAHNQFRFVYQLGLLGQWILFHRVCLEVMCVEQVF